jgi:hypothetical protein
MKKIETVHVVFKTHLDIGFTDLAEKVVDQYILLFIPKAIELAEKLAEENSAERFLWTTGSWLIHEYLKRTSGKERKALESAIVKGHVAWHGLPFTTHTELMDVRLFEYGLSLSKKLDKMFGKNTIAAKMTDVPGHTIAIVPHMAKYGLKYLHLGVNPASKKPAVPNVFLWRSRDGSEIIVNYAANYGDILEIDGLRDVLVFAHTDDNCGPPDLKDIKRKYEQLAAIFPGAKIKASTMDAFAERLWELRDRLPVVHEEIGDTWIHGIATDPGKVSQYRELLRMKDAWIREGRLDIDSKEYEDFCDNLLLIPEHTWGLDLKKYLTDYKNYSKNDFNSARKTDLIAKDAIPEKYDYIGEFAMGEFNRNTNQIRSTAWENRTYSFFESSWSEQRGYIHKALSSLSQDKQEEAAIAFGLLKPKWEELKGSSEIEARETLTAGLFEVQFDYDGSIVWLKDKSGKIWADETYRLGGFTYESFGKENYDEWFEKYVENLRETNRWADSDFGKPGFEYANPKPAHKQWQPILRSLHLKREDHHDIVRAQLQMPQEPVEMLGAPEKLIVNYRFCKNERKVDVEISWFNKQACRLPEAAWVSFRLKVDNPNLWKMEKMGEWLSPLKVVKNGNRNLHAVNRGVSYHGADGTAFITTFDAPLLSPGEKRLLKFDNTFASLDGGMHFNLHNNIWGTNFPMWYQEDAKFRFSLKLESARI